MTTCFSEIENSPFKENYFTLLFACTSSFNFSSNHAVIIQIFGRKRICLFPPSQSRNLYPFSAQDGPPRTSRMDLGKLIRGCAEEESMFPLFASVTQQLHVVIDAGEMLYIPPHWWHFVAAVDDNASVLMPFDLSSTEQAQVNRQWTKPDWGVYTRQ